MNRSQKKIFYLGEGNSQVGMGHISRLIAVSMQLKNCGTHTFCILNPDKAVNNILHKQKYIKIEPLVDYFQFFENNQDFDLLIMDGYNFPDSFFSMLNLKTGKVIYIDDLNEKNLPVDIIINHTEGYLEEDYKALTSTLFFLGYDYAILRYSFFKSVKKRKINKIETIFISLGMSNSNNLLDDLVTLVLKCFVNVNVLILRGNNIISMKNEINTRTYLLPHLSAEELCRVLDKVELAIVPVSTLYLEAMARNINVAGGYFVENQEVVYNKLKGKKIIYELGDFRDLDEIKLKKMIKNLENNLPIKIDNQLGKGWAKIEELIFKM
ncbi:MAG: spore coat polysaccharide biosynthesis predicted glycosyltransferase SpsG [Polaribacter sp.]|jgi:spore coat polysaccharide biosynthesis predicted glycosyltransferase SpsG